MKSLEDTIKDQNRSLRNLLMKLAEDLRNSHQRCASNDAKGDTKSKEELIEQVRQLEAEIQHYNEIVAQLEEENRQFKNNLIQKKSDISQALGALKRSDMDISNLSQNIEGMVQERDQHVKEIAMLNEELQNNKQELKQLIKLHDELEEAFKDQKVTLEKTNQELQEKEAQMDILPPVELNGPEELKQEIERTRRQVFTKEKQILDLKSKLEHMQDNVKQFQEGFRKKELDIKRRDEKIDELHKKLKQADRKSVFSEAYTEESYTTSNTSDIDIVREGHLADKYEETVQENKTLKDTIAKLEQQLQEQNSNHEDMKVKMKHASDERIAQLEAELKELKDENIEYDEDNRHLSQQLEAMVGEIEILQREHKQLQSEKVQCMNEISKMEREYDDAVCNKDQAINHLSEQMKLAKEAQDVIKAEATAFKRHSVELESERDKLYAENLKLAAEVEELEVELNTAVNTTDGNCRSLQEKLERLECTVKEKENELDNACRELEKIQKYLEQCECKKHQGQSDEIIRLTSENKMFTEKIRALQDELARYKARLDNCPCADIKRNIPEASGCCGLLKLQAENTRLTDDKVKHEKTVKELQDELCQKNYIIFSLEECVDKTNKILADCEREIKELHCHRECLKKDFATVKVELEKKNYEIAAHKADKEALQEQVHTLIEMNQQLGKDNMQYAKQDQVRCEIEKKIMCLCEDYNTLLKDFNARDEELDKIKEQFEVLQKCCKTPFIHKEEFKRLKTASKEIRTIFSSQSKKTSFRTEAKIPECTKCLDALVDNTGSRKIDCKLLEQKNNSLSTEVIIMKKFVHDILIDNNNLKQGILNLLTTVIDKLKVLEGHGTICPSTVEIVARALTALEKKLKESAKPSCCPIPKCTCMKEICMSYSRKSCAESDSDPDPKPKSTMCAAPREICNCEEESLTCDCSMEDRPMHEPVMIRDLCACEVVL
ncbi:unnamed protein product [Acanthoscelides obtectus]|nr:unnamed protein product [Acanthoscelides obtectus]CAK1665721.1 hypothetical protein AOBTE_LOCUS24934 [Acanthoscelides obtectus]